GHSSRTREREIPPGADQEKGVKRDRSFASDSQRVHGQEEEEEERTQAIRESEERNRRRRRKSFSNEREGEKKERESDEWGDTVKKKAKGRGENEEREELSVYRERRDLSSSALKIKRLMLNRSKTLPGNSVHTPETSITSSSSLSSPVLPPLTHLITSSPSTDPSSSSLFREGVIDLSPEDKTTLSKGSISMLHRLLLQGQASSSSSSSSPPSIQSSSSSSLSPYSLPPELFSGVSTQEEVKSSSQWRRQSERMEGEKEEGERLERERVRTSTRSDKTLLPSSTDNTSVDHTRKLKSEVASSKFSSSSLHFLQETTLHLPDDFPCSSRLGFFENHVYIHPSITLSCPMSTPPLPPRIASSDEAEIFSSSSSPLLGEKKLYAFVPSYSSENARKTSLFPSCGTPRRQVYVHLVSGCTSTQMKHLEEGKLIRTWRVNSVKQLDTLQPPKKRAYEEPHENEEKEEERNYGEEKLFHTLADWVVTDRLHATVFLLDGRGDFAEREKKEVDDRYRRTKEEKEGRSKDKMLSATSFVSSSVASPSSSSSSLVFSLLLGEERHRPRRHTTYQRDKEQEEEGKKGREARERGEQEENDLDEDTKNEKIESFLEKLMDHLFTQVIEEQEEKEEGKRDEANLKSTVYIGLSIFLLLGDHVADLLSSSSHLSSSCNGRNDLPCFFHSPRCLACLVSYLPSSFSSPISSSSFTLGKNTLTPIEEGEVSGVRTLQVRDLHELREILRVARTRLDSLRFAYQRGEREGGEEEDPDYREVSKAFFQDSKERKEMIGNNKAGADRENEEEEERKSRRRPGSPKRSEPSCPEEILCVRIQVLSSSSAWRSSPPPTANTTDSSTLSLLHLIEPISLRRRASSSSSLSSTSPSSALSSIRGSSSLHIKTDHETSLRIPPSSSFHDLDGLHSTPDDTPHRTASRTSSYRHPSSSSLARPLSLFFNEGMKKILSLFRSHLTSSSLPSTAAPSSFGLLSPPSFSEVYVHSNRCLRHNRRMNTSPSASPPSSSSLEKTGSLSCRSPVSPMNNPPHTSLTSSSLSSQLLQNLLTSHSRVFAISYIPKITTSPSLIASLLDLLQQSSLHGSRCTPLHLSLHRDASAFSSSSSTRSGLLSPFHILSCWRSLASLYPHAISDIDRRDRDVKKTVYRERGEISKADLLAEHLLQRKKEEEEEEKAHSERKGKGEYSPRERMKSYEEGIGYSERKRDNRRSEDEREGEVAVVVSEFGERLGEREKRKVLLQRVYRQEKDAEVKRLGELKNKETEKNKKKKEKEKQEREEEGWRVTSKEKRKEEEEEEEILTRQATSNISIPPGSSSPPSLLKSLHKERDPTSKSIERSRRSIEERETDSTPVCYFLSAQEVRRKDEKSEENLLFQKDAMHEGQYPSILFSSSSSFSPSFSQPLKGRKKQGSSSASASIPSSSSPSTFSSLSGSHISRSYPIEGEGGNEEREESPEKKEEEEEDSYEVDLIEDSEAEEDPERQRRKASRQKKECHPVDRALPHSSSSSSSFPLLEEDTEAHPGEEEQEEILSPRRRRRIERVAHHSCLYPSSFYPSSSSSSASSSSRALPSHTSPTIPSSISPPSIELPSHDPREVASKDIAKRDERRKEEEREEKKTGLLHEIESSKKEQERGMSTSTRVKITPAPLSSREERSFCLSSQKDRHYQTKIYTVSKASSQRQSGSSRNPMISLSPRGEKEREKDERDHGLREGEEEMTCKITERHRSPHKERAILRSYSDRRGRDEQEKREIKGQMPWSSFSPSLYHCKEDKEDKKRQGEEEEGYYTSLVERKENRKKEEEEGRRRRREEEDKDLQKHTIAERRAEGGLSLSRDSRSLRRIEGEVPSPSNSPTHQHLALSSSSSFHSLKKRSSPSPPDRRSISPSSLKKETQKRKNLRSLSPRPLYGRSLSSNPCGGPPGVHTLGVKTPFYLRPRSHAGNDLSPRQQHRRGHLSLQNDSDGEEEELNSTSCCWPLCEEEKDEKGQERLSSASPSPPRLEEQEEKTKRKKETFTSSSPSPPAHASSCSPSHGRHRNLLLRVSQKETSHDKKETGVTSLSSLQPRQRSADKAKVNFHPRGCHSSSSGHLERRQPYSFSSSCSSASPNQMKNEISQRDVSSPSSRQRGEVDRDPSRRENAVGRREEEEEGVKKKEREDQKKEMEERREKEELKERERTANQIRDGRHVAVRERQDCYRKETPERWRDGKSLSRKDTREQLQSSKEPGITSDTFASARREKDSFLLQNGSLNLLEKEETRNPFLSLDSERKSKDDKKPSEDAKKAIPSLLPLREVRMREPKLERIPSGGVHTPKEKHRRLSSNVTPERNERLPYQNKTSSSSQRGLSQEGREHHRKEGSRDMGRTPEKSLSKTPQEQIRLESQKDPRNASAYIRDNSTSSPPCGTSFHRSHSQSQREGEEREEKKRKQGRKTEKLGDGSNGEKRGEEEQRQKKKPCQEDLDTSGRKGFISQDERERTRKNQQRGVHTPGPERMKNSIPIDQDLPTSQRPSPSSRCERRGCGGTPRSIDGSLSPEGQSIASLRGEGRGRDTYRARERSRGRHLFKNDARSLTPSPSTPSGRCERRGCGGTPRSLEGSLSPTGQSTSSLRSEGMRREEEEKKQARRRSRPLSYDRNRSSSPFTPSPSPPGRCERRGCGGTPRSIDGSLSPTGQSISSLRSEGRRKLEKEKTSKRRWGRSPIPTNQGRSFTPTPSPPGRCERRGCGTGTPRSIDSPTPREQSISSLRSEEKRREEYKTRERGRTRRSSPLSPDKKSTTQSNSFPHTPSPSGRCERRGCGTGTPRSIDAVSSTPGEGSTLSLRDSLHRKNQEEEEEKKMTRKKKKTSNPSSYTDTHPKERRAASVENPRGGRPNLGDSSSSLPPRELSGVAQIPRRIAGGKEGPLSPGDTCSSGEGQQEESEKERKRTVFGGEKGRGRSEDLEEATLRAVREKDLELEVVRLKALLRRAIRDKHNSREIDHLMEGYEGGVLP
ncbi:hypothetical protein CSUI_002379, partial [Cystoisospora suis]